MASERGGRFEVCALDDIADPGSRGFVAPGQDWPINGFVVRRGDHVYAYLNVCPHAGRTLNWGPDRFLTRDASQIMCSAHGAVFEIDTGECVAGPCLGDTLTRLAARVEEGQVVVYT